MLILGIMFKIRAYGIDMTTAPDSTAAQLNVDGATMNGDLTVTNNMLLQSDPNYWNTRN